MEETKSVIDKSSMIDCYNNMTEEDRKILDASYSVVSETAASADRVEEIKLFSKKLGFKKIGIAFCKGLRAFGERVDSELSDDFDVYSVCCNVCGISKDEINAQPLKDGVEPACNPVGQAEVLNKNEVDYTIKCGFCLGHDMIFQKNIKSPTTTLFVKDRKYKHKTIEKYN